MYYLCINKKVDAKKLCHTFETTAHCCVLAFPDEYRCGAVPDCLISSNYEVYTAGQNPNHRKKVSSLRQAVFKRIRFVILPTAGQCSSTGANKSHDMKLDDTQKPVSTKTKPQHTHTHNQIRRGSSQLSRYKFWHLKEDPNPPTAGELLLLKALVLANGLLPEK